MALRILRRDTSETSSGAGTPERCGAYISEPADSPPGPERWQCPEPSVMTVMTGCECDHGGLRPSCAARGPDAPSRVQICGPCADRGHWCPTEVVRIA
jgi:hypothetical protein